MRISVIAVAAALLMPLAITPASACGAAKAQALASTTDYSAAKKKPVRKPKEKVEYMRAAPMK